MSLLRPYAPSTPPTEHPEITPGSRVRVRFLERPIDLDLATRNRIAWDRFEARWMNVTVWGAVLAILGAVLMVLSVAMTRSLDTMVYPMFLAVAGCGIMTISGCMVMIAGQEKHGFSPLGDQFLGEFHWLLARTPDGQALRAYLDAHPRAPLAGEFNALRMAHQQAGSPQTLLDAHVSLPSSPSHGRSHASA